MELTKEELYILEDAVFWYGSAGPIRTSLLHKLQTEITGGTKYSTPGHIVTGRDINGTLVFYTPHRWTQKREVAYILRTEEDREKCFRRFRSSELSNIQWWPADHSFEPFIRVTNE